jgi:hypothetical protein
MSLGTKPKMRERTMTPEWVVVVEEESGVEAR